MNTLLIRSIFILLICQSALPYNAMAYKQDMHKKITEYAVTKSERIFLSLQEIGLVQPRQAIEKVNLFGKDPGKWIQYGSDWEDGMAVSVYWSYASRGVLFNHFYSPLNNLGYVDILGNTAGQSLIERSHDAEVDVDGRLMNEWSYEMAKKLYYAALTGSTDYLRNDVIFMRDGHEFFDPWIPVSAQFNQEVREKLYAWTFQALGHALHLIQDAAVPAHTRNDLHNWSEPYERWTGENISLLEKNKYFTLAGDSAPWGHWKQHPNIPVPDVFIDTDQLNQNSALPISGQNQGLSEYSHANFLSQHTVSHFNLPTMPAWSGDLPSYFDGDYVLETRTINGKDKTFVYLTKQNEGGVKHLALCGIFHHKIPGNDIWEPEWYDVRYTVDDAAVHEDYAQKLIPRAVGYSAGLLDYFFRGRIEIAEPSVSVGSDCAITGVSLSMKNSTPPLDSAMQVEPFVNGTIDLVYSYLPPDSEERVYHLYPAIYSIDDSTDKINSEFVPVEISSLDPQPPPGAKDFSVLLVFRGTLGNETGAVAAQVHNFSSSRIAYYYQPDGPPNVSNIYTVSPERFDPVQITNATTGNPWYFEPAWSHDARMLAFEKEVCTDPNSTPGETCPSPYYIREILVVDSLSTQNFPDNILHTLNYGTADAALPAFSPDSAKVATLLLRENRWYWGELALYDLSTGTFSTINTGDDPDLVDFAGSRPAWSPDGEWLVYYLGWQYNPAVGQMEFQGDLIRIRPDGTGKTRLTDDEFINTQPDWSADGNLIAFASDRDGENSMDIWVMDKDGNNLKRIVNCTPASCYVPTFSPDGQHIAFSQGSIIYVSDMAGNVTTIGRPGLLTGSLDWSPELCRPQ